MNISEALETGRTTFMGIELLVAPGVLVPRPETELLGKTAVQMLRAIDLHAPRVIDMCCGAGNLGCAIAHHVPLSSVWCCDLTDQSVSVARRNVAFLHFAHRVSVHQGDLFGALMGYGLEGTIDMIVCNPPYISDKRLSDERASLLELEPREAFAAGPYGVSIHARVVKDAFDFLRPGGIMLFEVGLGQDRQVITLFQRTKAYDDVSVIHDEAREGRVVFGRRTR